MCPVFSIVVPTKNRAILLSDTIYSILNQSFDNLELIVVDNDDTEETASIVREYKDDRLVYVRTGGLSMARNWQEGLNSANGLYVILNADKSLLKPGALSYLNEVLKTHTTADAISFEYDAFYDDEKLFLRRTIGGAVRKVEPKALLDSVFSMDYDTFSQLAPRGYNACISNNFLKSVKALRGDLCLPFNPDYSVAYHLILSNANLVYTPQALQIVRFKSLVNKSIAYGNGGSYFFKSDLFKSFLRENNIGEGQFCSNVPIKSWMVYNILTDDFLNVCRLYGVKHKDRFDMVKYYFINYKETCSRESYGVDVQEELSAWRSALDTEPAALRRKVLIKLLPLRMRNIFYSPYRWLQAFTSKLLMRQRAFDKKHGVSKYSSVIECLNNNSVAS